MLRGTIITIIINMIASAKVIDIHTHILPGVDDGAADIEESIRIIENGKSAGINTFILTPHIRNDNDWSRIDQIRETYLTLKQECSDRGLSVRLILAAEISITPDLPDMLKKNPLVTINEKYVLVELPFTQLPIYTEEILYKLSLNYTPIIAHPERYMYLIGKTDLIQKWVEKGIMMQINTGSLEGQYGIRVKWLAKKLLKLGLVHFVASDVHSGHRKADRIKQTFKLIEKIAGSRAHKILVEYPETIINPKAIANSVIKA
jgi:protein-tyrosine phosphatase